jgi:hypothetical protein
MNDDFIDGSFDATNGKLATMQEFFTYNEGGQLLTEDDAEIVIALSPRNKEGIELWVFQSSGTLRRFNGWLESDFSKNWVK